MLQAVRHAVARRVRPEREALLDRLRALGRPKGVKWLRKLLNDYDVDSMRDISTADLRVLVRREAA